MRIEKIVLKNYRQFRDNVFLFETKKVNGSDLHVFVGENGTGKTNILNAINWCLYGEEAHLSKDSQQLPMLNLKCLQESKDGEDKEILVNIWTETENNRYILFMRKGTFRVYKGNKDPASQGMNFEVKAPDEDGNTKILKDEEAESYVERFVPRRIKEFFFFDGERLDNYFREASAQNIRHAVFQISGIDLLETVADKLDKLTKDITKEAGKLNPKIEETNKQKEKKEAELKDVEKQLKDINVEIAIARENIRKLEENLRGIPDVKTLEKEREELTIKLKEKEQLKNRKINEKQKLLFDYGKIIMVYPAIMKSIQNLRKKRQNGEIPPPIDKGLLESIIQSRICSICGRDLDDNAQKHAKDLFENIKLTPEAAQQLQDMEGSLTVFQEKIKDFKKEIAKITEDITDYGKDIAQIELRLNQINKELSGYNVEEIGEWHKEREGWEKILYAKLAKLGILLSSKKELEKIIEDLKAVLEEELKKEKKATKLKKQMDFLNKGLSIVEKTKNIIMEETREKIETETKKMFFELLWKKETFQDVKIYNDYNICLVHAMGYDCLGSMSAGERELLALSFTLALHKVSGFNSPILIDTPVARISDKHRETLGDVFSKVSIDKQIILLFTGTEYSEHISKKLDPKACNRYNLKLSSDEREVKVEVVRYG